MGSMAYSFDISKDPIGIVGTGMMARGIATLYASSGLHLFIGSRDAERGDQFAKLIKGQTRKFSETSTVRGGKVSDVLDECKVIILAIPAMVRSHERKSSKAIDGVIDFLNQYDKLIRGKNKILIDISYHGYSFGKPTPPTGFTSALVYHAETFGDSTTAWVGGYKSVSWTSLRDSKFQGIEIAGDTVGRKIFSEIIVKTGFIPLDCGDLSIAGVIEPGGPQRKPHPQADV